MTRSKRNSGTITGGTIQRSGYAGTHALLSLFAGSVRYAQSTIEAIGKRGDDSRYAHLSPIASVKATRLTIVPSLGPEITQEGDGQSSEMGACF
jgi:hypothetical protein